MLKRRWWLQDENDGQGNDLGGSTGEGLPTAPGSNESAPEPSSQVPAEDEPKTMLEAIDKGLAKVAEHVPEKKVEGEQAPAKVEDKNPEANAKPDDITQMPEGLTPKAQERFKSLVTKIKEQDTAYDDLDKRYQSAHQYASEVSNAIKEVGATPDQLQGAMQYIHAFNSGDLQTRKTLLLRELQDVSMKLGEPVENFIGAADPLNQFPDLKQAVDAYQIGREQALEVARLRTNENQRLQAKQEQDNSQQGYQNAVQNWKREADEATGMIEKLTAEMSRSDPLYHRVEAVLMKGGGLNEIVKNFPPSTWVSQVKMLISSVKQAMPANADLGEPRPLSGGSGKPQGSGKAPASMFEAMFPK